MNYFTIVILILLILAIVNNFIMYYKWIPTRYSSESQLRKGIGFYPVNVYYSKDMSNTKCYEYPNIENPLIGDLKGMLMQFENTNKGKCVVTFGEPSTFELVRINEIDISR